MIPPGHERFCPALSSPRTILAARKNKTTTTHRARTLRRRLYFRANDWTARRALLVAHCVAPRAWERSSELFRTRPWFPGWFPVSWFFPPLRHPFWPLRDRSPHPPESEPGLALRSRL